MQRVVVLGQGYVGLPLAIRAAEVGFDVVGFDVDVRRIERLRCGDSYIEDVSSEALRSALDSGGYRPSADPAHLDGFDVAIISVPTPLRHGAPELGFVTAAAELVGARVRPGTCVILESTTYPGTTDEVVVPCLERGSGLRAGVDFSVGYSPERIDPSNPRWNLRNTPKIVSGIDERSLERVDEFFRQIVDTTVRVPGVKEAELAKLLENTFRHVNIALVNELAVFADELGIDIWSVIDAAATKPFGFMRFTPGPGVGGHCLPIDPSYLSWEVRRSLGRAFRFVELANDVNDHMPDYVVHRISRRLNDAARSIRGACLVVVGLAYKPNSGDAPRVAGHRGRRAARRPRRTRRRDRPVGRPGARARRDHARAPRARSAGVRRSRGRADRPRGGRLGARRGVRGEGVRRAQPRARPRRGAAVTPSVARRVRCVPRASSACGVACPPPSPTEEEHPCP